MAEYYSAELAEKVARGMTENVLKGLFNGGPITFGYKINDERKFEPHETFAPIVVDVFNMYADGRTIKYIIDYLDERKIRSYRGGKIGGTCIQRMLSNRRYLGEYKFRDVVVPNCIPPLISEELFEKVQRRLVKNKQAAARFKADEEYLLTLKLFCGKCGTHMVGESGMGTSKVYRYYKCAKTKKVHLCNKKPVRKEWIEDLVVTKAMEILNDEKLVDYLAERIYVLQGEENPRIPRLKEQLADIEKRIENIMNAIEQGIITNTTKARLAQLESQKKETEISLLQEKIKKPFLTKEQIIFGIEKFKQLDITTLEGKRRLIDGFVNSIYLFDDKITITFNFKDSTQTAYLSEIEAAKNSDSKFYSAPEMPVFTRKRAFFLHFLGFCDHFAISTIMSKIGLRKFDEKLQKYYFDKILPKKCKYNICLRKCLRKMLPTGKGHTPKVIYSGLISLFFSLIYFCLFLVFYHKNISILISLFFTEQMFRFVPY